MVSVRFSDGKGRGVVGTLGRAATRVVVHNYGGTARVAGSALRVLAYR